MTSTSATSPARPRGPAHKAATNERDWCDSEREIMRKDYPIGGFARVSKRLNNRTKSAVYSMAHEMNVKVRPAATTPQRLDSAIVAKGLGVDTAVVLDWIRARGLKATLRDGQYVITAAALRRWIGQHPRLIALSQVDQAWFLALAFPQGRSKAG